MEVWTHPGANVVHGFFGHSAVETASLHEIKHMHIYQEMNKWKQGLACPLHSACGVPSLIMPQEPHLWSPTGAAQTTQRMDMDIDSLVRPCALRFFPRRVALLWAKAMKLWTQHMPSWVLKFLMWDVRVYTWDVFLQTQCLAMPSSSLCGHCALSRPSLEGSCPGGCIFHTELWTTLLRCLSLW